MSEKPFGSPPWIAIEQVYHGKDGYTWSAYGIEQDPAVYGDDSCAIVYAQKMGGLTKSQAEFIVRACNAHEDLLSACKMLLAKLEGHLRDEYEGTLYLDEYLAELEPAHAAIEKAGAP